MSFFKKLFTSSESSENPAILKEKVAKLTETLKGIKVNDVDLFTYLNNYSLLTTLYTIIRESKITFSKDNVFTGAQGGYENKLYYFLKNVKDINHPPHT